MNRSGVDAIAWLPLAGGSISLYASANPSHKAGSLLMFPECASLRFPHRPSAQRDDLINRSPFMYINLPAIRALWKSPAKSFLLIT